MSGTGSAIRWEVDPGIWLRHASALTGGPTPEQWAELVPEQDYISFCPTADELVRGALVERA